MKNPLLRLLAHPAGWLYAVGSYADRLLDGLRSRLRLGGSVISIGNIAVGGSGKTPFTRWLAGELTRRGHRVGVVTRGYGGSWARGHREPTLVSRGDGTTLLNPTEAGDEAVWLAGELPRCAVAIGRIKAAAARLLTQETDAEVILLDDGLQ
ncbi:tetraacyldisaccharide 4'-kinase, partial [bacterium]|nr:tetraacyldisaccharide 4'-kinase [bacterium]